MVERFELDFHGLYGEDAYMAKAENGEFVRYSDYAALEAQLAEAKAVLHIATNDKLAQIDYSCDLQRIIEDLCRGGPVREPKTSARHHYDMATAALSALEATPAPKETEEMIEAVSDAIADTAEIDFNGTILNRAEVARAALTAAQEAGKP